MAQDHIIEWMGVVLLFVFGITLMCQGHFIITGKHGYRHVEREKSKMNSARKQVENLLKNK